MKFLMQSLMFTTLFVLAACNGSSNGTQLPVDGTTTVGNSSTFTFSRSDGGDWVEDVGGDFDQEEVCKNAFPESGVVFKASDNSFAYCLRNNQDYESLVNEVNSYCHGLASTFRYLYEGTGEYSTLGQGLRVPSSFTANCYDNGSTFYLHYGDSTFDTYYSSPTTSI